MKALPKSWNSGDEGFFVDLELRWKLWWTRRFTNIDVRVKCVGIRSLGHCVLKAGYNSTQFYSPSFCEKKYFLWMRQYSSLHFRYRSKILDNLKITYTVASSQLCQIFFLNSEILSECQLKLKTNLKKRFQCVFEKITKASSSKPLHEIYTEIYIMMEETGEVNMEHEVRQIETATWKPPTLETSIRCEDIFKAITGGDDPVRAIIDRVSGRQIHSKGYRTLKAHFSHIAHLGAQLAICTINNWIWNHRGKAFCLR